MPSPLDDRSTSGDLSAVALAEADLGVVGNVGDVGDDGVVGNVGDDGVPTKVQRNRRSGSARDDSSRNFCRRMSAHAQEREF